MMDTKESLEYQGYFTHILTTCPKPLSESMDWIKEEAGRMKISVKEYVLFRIAKELLNE